MFEYWFQFCNQNLIFHSINSYNYEQLQHKPVKLVHLRVFIFTKTSSKYFVNKFKPLRGSLR